MASGHNQTRASATTSALRLSAAEIAAASRWVRGVWLGQDSLAARARAQLSEPLRHLTPQQVTQMLWNAVDICVASGRVTSKDARLWLAHRALIEIGDARGALRRQPPTSRSVRTTCERVERELARVDLYVPRRSKPERHDALLAALHSRLAWRVEQDDAEWAALNHLRLQAGHDVVSERGNVARHRRQRIARRQRRDLARPLGPVRPVPQMAPLPPLDFATMAVVLAADDLYVWDSRRASTRSEVAKWRLYERDVMKMPRDLAVRAWSLQRRIWREDEDFRALNASRVLRSLAGDSLEAVHCFRDDAIVLQAHGYPALAFAACERALAILRHLELEPWVAAVEKGQILGRAAVTMPMSGEIDRRNRKRWLLDRAIDVTLAGGAAAERTGLATLMRQQIELEVQWHLACRRPGRPACLHLADGVLQGANDAVEAKAHDSLLRTTLASVTYEVGAGCWLAARFPGRCRSVHQAPQLTWRPPVQSGLALSNPLPQREGAKGSVGASRSPRAVPHNRG
jgi:hypothetical protein